LLVHHFHITGAYGILAGEISKDNRNAGMIAAEQFGFVVHQGMSVFSSLMSRHDELFFWIDAECDVLLMSSFVGRTLL
jgi:hypothetical protein